MKFTIITPNKNGGRFLEETIQSVLNQREAGIDLEYIVLDGGSTDASPAILSRYEGEISQIVCEADSGPVSAINKGLKMATGEIIAWLNADDRYHAGTLRRVSATLSRHRDSALCFGACRIIDESGQEIRRGITRFKELFLPSFLAIRDSVSQLHLPAGNVLPSFRPGSDRFTPRQPGSRLGL